LALISGQSLIGSGEGMKIYISVDMEGITGVSHRRFLLEKEAEYERGRKLLMGDLNAAIEGAVEAGVDEILVNDAHGSMRNIVIEDLHEKADLITGFPKENLMMSGIDSTFDAVILVGYHAKAGSHGVLAHTISGKTFVEIEINGTSYGEAGLSAALAGFYSVPVVMLSGDDILKEEVSKFLPDAEVAVVKERMSNTSAKMIHPQRARKAIREKAKAGILKCKAAGIFDIGENLKVKISLKEVSQCDIAQAIPGIERTSPREIEYIANDIPEVNNMIITIFSACCILDIGLY